jgi:polysaccharide export outer membrane protein
MRNVQAVVAALAASVMMAAVVTAASQQATGSTTQKTKTAPVQTVAAPPKPATSTAPPPPPDYVIGPDDVLEIQFRREKDMSAEVAVRPDGKISLPLLNDIQAAGLTPEQLRQKVTDEANKLVEDASVTVLVKQVKSRVVFITGQVNKPGVYPLTFQMNVLQLIAVAGGLNDIAKGKQIVVIRPDPAAPSRPPLTYGFNYNEVIRRKNLKQNIELKPGDTVVVP